MKPDFALNLSHDGLSLLQRLPGGWGLLGDVALDDPAMAQKLAELRQIAVDLTGADISCKLVIPNSQILYREFQDSEFADGAGDDAILAALDGETPYPVEELEFDWATDENGNHQVAAIAKQTLDEAESFAVEHRFNPVSFVAIPDPDTFTGEPFFGQSELAASLLGVGQRVAADDTAILIIEPHSETTELAEELAAPEPVPPAPPVGEVSPHLEQPEAPETDLTLPDDPTPTEGGFATSREPGSDPQLIVPNPNRPAARFLLYADKFEPEIEPLPDLGLGGDEPTPRKVAEGTVTARSLPGEKRDKPKPRKPEPQRRNPPMVATMSPPPDTARNAGAGDTGSTETGVRRQVLDGENLTVFGARRTAREQKNAAPLGLLVGLGALVFAIFAVLAWAFFPATGPDLAITQPSPAPVTSSQTSTLSSASSPDQTNAENGGPLVPDTALDLTPQSPAPSDLATADDPIAGVVPDTSGTAFLPPEQDGDQLASLGTDPVENPAIPGTGEGLHADSLTLETARNFHDNSGIWPLAPTPPVDLDVGRTDDIYVASIDRRIITHDAIALPSGPGTAADAPLREMLAPPPAGTTFDLNDRGFVRASPQGSLTPQGILIFAGRPATVPRLRPGTNAPETPPETQLTTAPGTRPLARPGNLIEVDEKARLGGRTRTQLAGIRPLARPASAQDIVAPIDSTPTALAVLASRNPTLRPNGFSGIVEKALAEALANAPDTTDTPSNSAIAAPSNPSIPTRASVARAATTENAINLSRVNLIGVYGSSSDRRALVRLKSGRFVKVQVGDRLDGGKVAAISSDQLQYTKSGRTLTLEIAS